MAKLKTVRQLQAELEHGIEVAINKDPTLDASILALDAAIKIEGLKCKRSSTAKSKAKHFAKFLKLRNKMKRLYEKKQALEERKE